MRVVLDSNILFSALIQPLGAPHRLYEARGRRRLELTCPTQLDETRRASRYPKLRPILQPHRVGALVKALRAVALPDPPVGNHDLDDPDDAWPLALADVSGAQWVVTGDHRSMAPRASGPTGPLTSVTCRQQVTAWAIGGLHN